jgi:putative membrane protein
MRFDPRTVSLAKYLGVLLFNLYALLLYANGQLTLYIHPRYVVFTVVLNAASALVCLVGAAVTAWRMVDGGAGLRVAWRPSATLVLAGLVLAAAYALPARTLSSETADQRGENLNVAQPAASGGADTLALFGADTSGLSIPDWVSAFNLKADADFYEGKKVEVVGFVFHPEGAPPDVFYVSRFRVTCCAVDAQPIGLPVRDPGWQERLQEDQWVRVSGRFVEADDGVAEPAVVEPRTVERTSQPKNPYVVV